MAENFADRLLAAIAEKDAPVCVGIDPVHSRLPEGLSGADELEQIVEFSTGVLKSVAPVVPAVKVQSAYFELYRGDGVTAYFEIVRRARELGLLVIGDVKRNDIGTTAQAYADAHLAGDDAPDAVTISAYFGTDGIDPFLDICREEGKGLFVLVRTSNPSGAAIQDFAGVNGKRLFEHVAEEVHVLGDAEGLTGAAGMSCVGAVVGATYPNQAEFLREVMPKQMFLVPGYGAQGATAEDCAASFKSDGTGAIVNASRSVIYAFEKQEYREMDWTDAIAAAARAFAEDIAGAVRKHAGR